MEGERGKLYIGGLSMETSEADLMEYFSRYCEVRDANIVAGTNYGFVTLVDESMIDQILGEENVILGRRVVVNRARRRNNANDRSVQTSLLGYDLVYPYSSFYYHFPHFCAWPFMTRPVQYNYYQSVYEEVVENRARPRNNGNDRSVLGYDLVYPYSSFYDPSRHCCARPYMTRQVQHNYYQRVYQVGESSGSPSSILPSSSANVSAVSSPRRDYFGSSSSIVPYGPSPTTADPILINDGETTSGIGPAGSNATGVANFSNGFDDVSNTSTEWDDKFVDSIGNLQIGSSSAANTNQNGDDPANNSEVI